MEDKLEIITGLAQSTGFDNEKDEGKYLQYNENGEIDTEISKTLIQIKSILDLDFEGKGIESYKKITLELIKQNSIFKEREIQKIIDREQIEEEDFHLIISIYKTPNNILQNHHNSFNINPLGTMQNIVNSGHINNEVLIYYKACIKLIEKYTNNTPNILSRKIRIINKKQK